ncbi:MAG: hypothetical protein OM95_14635 [Bdellovibrio sp. ArHS]|uniref:hypothetical protein n=1 Tax=Bdellovibrio sp. ArHS TaxID=1569284 RepID=UPI0005829FE2|nr:hypothetical protein [Bdellovibrio sp. ArHS]KHD87417.1 MAG: hypothetical protein OM95_14635 [Bdellovibrio sp. ArHS]
MKITIFALFVSIFILGGCASSAFLERLERGFSPTERQPEETVSFYKDNLDQCANEYILCMEVESDSLVSSKSNAYEIADASQARCLNRFDKYGAAFRKYLVVSNENHYSPHVENLVQTHLVSLEKDAKSKIIYKVVNSRR